MSDVKLETPPQSTLTERRVTVSEPCELRDFLKMELPRPSSIVGNKIVIPGGLTVFGAQPKIGKSNLLQQLALARADGQDWVGFPTTPGRTLYVNAEIVASEFQVRFEQMLSEREQPPRESVYVVTVLGRNCHLNTDDGKILIEKFIEQVQPDLVILDPLSHLLWGDESKPDNMKPFLHTVARLRIKYGVAIIVIHHLRKPQRDPRAKNDRPTAHDLSGSSLLYREADSIIIGHGTPGGGWIDLTFDLRHAAPPEIFRIQRGPDLWWSRMGKRSIPESLHEPLAHLLSEGLTYTAWKKAIGATLKCSDKTAKRRIEECVDKGFARKGKKARYELTAETRQAWEESETMRRFLEETPKTE